MTTKLPPPILALLIFTSIACAQNKETKPNDDAEIARLQKVIEQNQDHRINPQARLDLANLYIAKKEWDAALAELQEIHQTKAHFPTQREKRAEAILLLGNVAVEKDDPMTAAKAYLSVLVTYSAYPEFSTEAFYRYFQISRSQIATEPDAAKKEKREKALYRVYIKYLYMWQNLTEKDSPSGALNKLRGLLDEAKKTLHISAKDERETRYKLSDDWQPPKPTKK